MTDDSETVVPVTPENVLDETVDVRSATLDSNDSGVTFFYDGEKFLLAIFENGAGLITRMTPEVALAMGQAMAEHAVLVHADIEAVRAAEMAARKRKTH